MSSANLPSSTSTGCDITFFVYKQKVSRNQAVVNSERHIFCCLCDPPNIRVTTKQFVSSFLQP